MPRTTLLALAAALAAAPHAHAQCQPLELAKILGPAAGPGDAWGAESHAVQHVAISGDTLVFTAPGDDTFGQDCGCAHVYRLDAGTGLWLHEADLFAADGQPRDDFGTSVDIDGDTIVIGAQDDDDLGTDYGSAYVFERDGSAWTQRAKLLPGDHRPNDQYAPPHFGRDVAIDGDTIVVVATNKDETHVDQGSAYVYVRDGDIWIQQAKLVPDEVYTWQYFGCSVDIDGDTAVIGKVRWDAHVFYRTGSTWSYQAHLLPNDNRADYFSHSISLEGNLAAIGSIEFDGAAGDSGAVFLYERNDSQWSKVATLTQRDPLSKDYFGHGVALQGRTLLISANQRDNASGTGKAYVFMQGPGGSSDWSEVIRFAAADVGQQDRFGWSVGLDGGIAVIGSPGDDDAGSDAGAAYLFDLIWPVDLTADGLIDTRDVIAFLNLWADGDPETDWDGNGVVDTQDFTAFLNDWVAGC